MFEKEAEELFKKKPLGYEMKPELEIYKDGFKDGYNKANKWHYVKDGDLPKKTGEYLVYRISGYGSKYIKLIQYNSSRHFWCVDCQNDVIAWKEIVLPKES